MRILLLWPLLCLTAALAAQQPVPNDKTAEVAKAARKDPYTDNEEKGMTALGVVAYAPLVWGDNKRTTDIEKELGEGRVLWLETAHFRVGCNLASVGMPQEPQARQFINDDLAKLNKMWSKMPKRSSKLDVWLRAHLYAQRAEDLYAEIAELTGHDEKSGTFLGQKDKFLLLIFQKESDLARYLDVFCDTKSVFSQRHFCSLSGQDSLILCAQRKNDTNDEAQMYAQFRFMMTQMLLASGGTVPYWLSYGLAHWYERKIPSTLMNVGVRDDENVDENTQNDWEPKLAKRLRHDELVIPFADLASATDLGYFHHLQAWSRVDYLLGKDRVKFTEFLTGLKQGSSAQRQLELLQSVYGLDVEQFDAEWRKWALKTYK